MEFVLASICGLTGLLALDLLTLWQQKLEARRNLRLEQETGRLLSRVDSLYPRRDDQERKAA
ncbi:MAG: hypothetical protein WEB00_01950 [Dehalococcoidia bacterium]